MTLYAVVEALGLGSLVAGFLKPSPKEKAFLGKYGPLLRYIHENFSGTVSLENVRQDDFGMVCGGVNPYNADEFMKQGSDAGMIDVDPCTVKLSSGGRYFVNNYV